MSSNPEVGARERVDKVPRTSSNGGTAWTFFTQYIHSLQYDEYKLQELSRKGEVGNQREKVTMDASFEVFIMPWHHGLTFRFKEMMI